MRFVWLIFGNKSSSLLLDDDDEEEEEEEEEAWYFIQLVGIIIKETGRNLSKWASNYDRTMVGDTHKVLGLGWSAAADLFAFYGVTTLHDLCITK